MPTHPFITFEGPIAAGKTTIAGMLANHMRSELLREDFEGNEFLADFYADRERWSLAMQLWFLSSRHSQLRSASAAASGHMKTLSIIVISITSGLHTKRSLRP